MLMMLFVEIIMGLSKYLPLIGIFLKEILMELLILPFDILGLLFSTPEFIVAAVFVFFKHANNLFANFLLGTQNDLISFPGYGLLSFMDFNIQRSFNNGYNFKGFSELPKTELENQISNLLISDHLLDFPKRIAEHETLSSGIVLGDSSIPMLQEELNNRIYYDLYYPVNFDIDRGELLTILILIIGIGGASMQCFGYPMYDKFYAFIIDSVLGGILQYYDPGIRSFRLWLYPKDRDRIYFPDFPKIYSRGDFLNNPKGDSLAEKFALNELRMSYPSYFVKDDFIYEFNVRGLVPGTRDYFGAEFQQTFGAKMETYRSEINFQDPATPIAERIIDIHHHIFFFLVMVMIFVTGGLYKILYHFGYIIPDNTKQTNESLKILSLLARVKFTHNTTVEIIGTLVPSLILVAIALPSFGLMYAMDDVVDPEVTLKVIGHQGYGSYEYSDYHLNQGSYSFDSYMVPESELKVGQLRLLEVDNAVVLPLGVYVRLNVTASDVLHCGAVPSLGVKIDAVPHRINSGIVFLKRLGVFYGQCSEICGVNHGFMPIVVKSVNVDNYINGIENKIES